MLNKNIKIFPLILVLILNFALFISTPYSKTILNIFPLSDCIWSIIYFIVIFLGFNYYLYCFFMNPKIYNYKKAVLIFCILFAVRLILDLTYYFFDNTVSKSVYGLFVDFIFDIFFVYIIIKTNIRKNIFKCIIQKISLKDIRIITACVLVIVIFFVSLSLLLSKYFLLYSYKDKYTEDSVFYTFNSMNFIFESQIIRMIFASVSETAILYICNIIYCFNKEKNILPSRKRAITTARLIFSVVVIFIVLFIKICINRVGMISFISSPNSSGYVGDINKTYNDHSSIQIYRAKSRNENFLCYEKTNVDITQQENVLFSFNINTFCEYEILTDFWKNKIDTAEKNNILRAGLGNSVMVNDIEVIFYSNQYIVFVENTIPKIISFESICNIEENDILTEFLEKMINYGYWDFFEYGCDYLLKFDSDFINPYINRYAIGRFTENELSTNNDIKTEYMMKFSEEKLYNSL